MTDFFWAITTLAAVNNNKVNKYFLTGAKLVFWMGLLN
jgi:predicted branched-subunit amino acid permease